MFYIFLTHLKLFLDNLICHFYKMLIIIIKRVINFKDKQVVTKFGKIGIQNPASIINNFSSKEEAKKYTDSKIKQKINKGYI